MKNATIPSVRVEPELRAAAESVLRDNESLSSLVVQSLKANIKRRRLQQQFIANGLASREEAQQTREYYEASDILNELDDMLSQTDS